MRYRVLGLNHEGLNGKLVCNALEASCTSQSGVCPATAEKDSRIGSGGHVCTANVKVWRSDGESNFGFGGHVYLLGLAELFMVPSKSKELAWRMLAQRRSEICTIHNQFLAMRRALCSAGREGKGLVWVVEMVVC